MAEMWIHMGPQHPMTHGLWNLRIKVNGETITDAVPELGYLHRSVEKIGERRKYFMNTTLTDRLCYASAMTWTHHERWRPSAALPALRQVCRASFHGAA